MSEAPMSKSKENCLKKRRFANDMEARASALVSLSHHRNLIRLYVYDCPHCLGIHLTKQEGPRAKLVMPELPYYEPKTNGSRGGFKYSSPMFNRSIQFYLAMKLTRLLRNSNQGQRESL